MKINSISLISVVSILSCASAANAGVIADFYVGAMAGAGGQTMFADHKNESDTATVFGAVAGVDLPVFRIEGEYDYFNSKDLNTNAAMVNVYAKMPSTIILPYIGAGVGMVFGGDQTFKDNINNIKSEEKIDSTAAYQAMLGATIDILAIPLKFDIEGRVLYAPDVYTVTGYDVTPDMLQYNLRLKARYIF
jgi:opacity protein-like surface antigen